MSRLKQYAHSLASGYVLMGANILYTLASVPLALSYLSKAEFGLWALTTQLAGYIALLDTGVSGAVSRILIDHKDKPDGTEYGAMIQTGILVNLGQGAVVLGGGVLLASVLGGWLQVPRDLAHEFRCLIYGQAALLAGSFAARVFSVLLMAHQRYDVFNYAQVAGFAANFIALWFGLGRGVGVLSVIWAQAAGFLLSMVLMAAWCCRLRLFPQHGRWGQPTWRRFVEVFVFGWDIFLFAAGSLLINASQTIVITRVLGLEVAAVWSVCTRAFTLGAQAIFRLFDYSCAALAEMIVRSEHHRLRDRFRSLVTLSTSLSVAGASLLIVCNEPFVAWWTSGRIGWARINDVLLAVWLVQSVWVRFHTGLVGQTKEFRGMSWLCLAEGIFFLIGSSWAMPYGGLSALLLVSISGSLLFSLPYGFRRTAQYFGTNWREVSYRWCQPSLRLALWLAAPAALVAWLTGGLAVLPRLTTGGASMVLICLVLLVRDGLDTRLRQELARRIPEPLGFVRRLLAAEKSL